MGTRGRAVRFQREGDGRGGRAPRGLVVAGEASLDGGPAAVEHDDVLANRHPLPPRARRGARAARSVTGANALARRAREGLAPRERRFAQSGPPPRVARIPYLAREERLLFPLHLPSRRRSRSRVGQNGRRYPDAPGHALSGPQGRSRRPPPEPSPTSNPARRPSAKSVQSEA